MTQVYTDKTKPKQPASAALAAPRGKADKAKLRGASYAEGNALLNPDKGLPKDDKGKAPKDDKGKAPKADAPATNAAKAASPTEVAAPKPIEAGEGLTWRVSEVLVAREKAKEVMATTSKSLEAYRKMSLDELTALILYSTQAAYSMNDVLRGIETKPQEIAFWTPWCELATIALGKAQGASKAQMYDDFGATKAETAKVEDDQRNQTKDAAFAKKSKLGKFSANQGKAGRAEKKQRHARRAQGPAPATPDRAKTVPHLYRSLKLSSGYMPTFEQYRVGGTLEEKGFLSTSTTRAYGLTNRIMWRIWDPTGGAMIADISTRPQEDEVLFAPGQRVQIDEIKYVWSSYPKAGAEQIKGPKTESVSSPVDRFPKKDGTPMAYNGGHKEWEIEVRLLPRSDVPPAPKAAEAESAVLDDLVAAPDDALKKGMTKA